MRLLSALEPSLVWLPWKKADPMARAEQVWASPRVLARPITQLFFLARAVTFIYFRINDNHDDRHYLTM